ncbi:uncharacterized protein MKK02DRAFT_19454 [Dioszegia hungarica]|uniref:SecE/sec61-gamma protein n=1 Tax=Dioszegia hungarica TaxID=4972 RepID=A0AA38HFZ3_9TREE|nr:uncharacterized protein MKK02DRAFT_19454 [Dioszegia hungarica]KAI9639652.1 hypothetical protein MKK02DRAFT_19454 [Dioszegia hungarica]
MSERMKEFADLPRDFVKEGTQFVNRCTKPNKEGESTDSFAEYIQLCRAIAIGFVVMGFIGYFVKLIHIPM